MSNEQHSGKPEPGELPEHPGKGHAQQAPKDEHSGSDADTQDTQLDEELEESFPASDPPSLTQDPQ